jgi:ABC-type amino acid transport substrate-binding protein
MKIKDVIILLFSFTVLNAYSQERYSIGLLENYPWAYRAQSNEIQGIYPKLFREIQNKHKGDIKFDIQLMPLARIIHEMKQSRIDVTIMSNHPSRQKTMAVQMPIYKTPFVLFTQPNSGIEKLTDLKNKNVAMLIGGSGCPCLNKDTPYQKIKVSKHLQGLQMLMKNRVDAVAGPYVRLNERIKELNIQESIAKPIIYEWRTVSLWSSYELKQNSKRINLLTNAMSKSLEERLMENLLIDYFTPAERIYIKNPE